MKIEKRAQILRVYKKTFLNYFRNKAQITPDISLKGTLDFKYVTILNKRSFPLLKASLVSLYYSSKELPAELVIVSDGTFSEIEFSEYFNFWPCKISYQHWSDIRDYFANNGELDLAQWATKQIWGKKMAAILYNSLFGSVLYADSDVLWFDQLIDKSTLSSQVTLRTTIDNSINYDQDLIQHLNADYLNNLVPINCGVVFIKENLLKRSAILKEAIKFEACQPGNFSEQTIFALLVHEIGSLYPLATVESSISDSLWPILPNYKNYPGGLKARHYLWALKWMFWRDYYFLFVKNRDI
ncbi:MAG: hypothetical protein HC819_02200 [Cyclobacteriaceae bacterium]|nr:hypothetical protein [Cyclobacteriaceae bacterium]